MKLLQTVSKYLSFSQATNLESFISILVFKVAILNLLFTVAALSTIFIVSLLTFEFFWLGFGLTLIFGIFTIIFGAIGLALR